MGWCGFISRGAGAGRPPHPSQGHSVPPRYGTHSAGEVAAVATTDTGTQKVLHRGLLCLEATGEGMPLPAACPPQGHRLQAHHLHRCLRLLQEHPLPGARPGPAVPELQPQGGPGGGSEQPHGDHVHAGDSAVRTGASTGAPMGQEAPTKGLTGPTAPLQPCLVGMSLRAGTGDPAGHILPLG